ncbi:beta-carotene 15,15'-monooxygenase [Chryseobacterium sp. RR2-3-20]|uniref:beta-carotene 15,15'-monooxygenase n=1 Tax=Chryseobacterium sp. RR2-3-20 TaxID=2787626 RepID=UPI001ADECE71|nr:beta-carotene 15,15'-monooxygenase [Chryseobacterium sp. RR2-3-20]
MGLFKKWVPAWLAKIILFALLLPNMIMFFLPLANEDVAAGYYGIEPNDIQFTISLYYAGFASFYCLERRFYSYFTSKQYFIQFQLFQLLCCYLLFSSQILLVIFVVRFVQGMLFASAVNLYLSMATGFMKSFRAKEVAYSLFFGMLLCTSSFNNLITADLIDQYNFDIVYKLSMVMFASSVVVVLVCISSAKVFHRHTLIQLDVSSFILLAIILIGLGYLSVYGQQYYWFQNSEIIQVAVIIFFAVFFFVIRQFTLKRPYIDLSIFKEKNYLWAALLLFFMYIERFSFAYMGSFYKNILHMDPRHISYIFVFNLIGIITGVALAAWHQIKKSNVIWLWMCGFTALLIYHLCMVQMLDNAGNERYYGIPLFAHGLGVGLIMVPTILFAISIVPYYLAPSAAAFCLIVRFLGYTVSSFLTKYFTVYNYNIHYSRFLDYISNNNQFYNDKISGINLYLKNNGWSKKDIPPVTQKVFKVQLDNQILLRSIMDYYSVMIWLSLAVLFLLLCYYIKEKKVYVHFRPLLPI